MSAYFNPGDLVNFHLDTNWEHLYPEHKKRGMVLSYVPKVGDAEGEGYMILTGEEIWFLFAHELSTLKRKD